MHRYFSKRIYWMSGLCIALMFMNTTGAFTQENPRKSHKDHELAELYRELIDADPQLRWDSLVPLFRQKFIHYLKDNQSFDEAFNELSNYVQIISSSDGRIKFYCWNQRNEGTWLDLQCLAQYKLDNGNVQLIEVSSGQEAVEGTFTDSAIYDIHEIKKDKTVYYITFGCGSHGSGHSHNIVQVFFIEDEKLVKCTSCFPIEGDLVIEYPRSSTPNLKFDPLTHEISYNEFLLKDDIGFYEPTGRIVKLKWVEGGFVVQ
jgi:hypothetical protein